MRNVYFRGRLKQEGVLDMVKKWQQNWKQRVEEMSTSRVTKKIYDGEISGIPRKRWSCKFDQQYIMQQSFIVQKLYFCL